MSKQITPEQALALSYTPFRYESAKMKKTPRGSVPERDEHGDIIYETFELPRFIKPGESQASAIKRLRTSALGRTKQIVQRRFPRFIPGKTTTAEYVAQFERLNFLVPSESAPHLTRPAPYYTEGDLVEVLEQESEVEAEHADLV